MKLTKAWAIDALERVVSAFLLMFLGTLLLNTTDMLSLSNLHAAALAGVGAALVLVKSIIASLVPGTISPASVVKRKAVKQEPTPQWWSNSPGITLGNTNTVGNNVIVGYQAPSHTVHRRHITTAVEVPGKPLSGRHVEHDSRSKAYPYPADGTRASASWKRMIPILDQKKTGSCTAQAAVGALGTKPDWDALSPDVQKTLGESLALSLYSDEEIALGYGPFPPNDNGGSGLAIAKACKKRGLINNYLHIFSIAAAFTAIQTGPFIVGTNWYTGMDEPDADGVVTATGTIRGAHEYECLGYNEDTDLWEFPNSWATVFGLDGYFYYSTATLTKLLAEEGDATVLLPLTAPAPVPQPVPVPTPTPSPTPPSSVVTVDDGPLVTEISKLAAKAKVTPHDYLQNRLRSLWKVK